MAQAEKAKVFTSGRSQAVRIPAAYRFKSKEVFIHRNPQNGDITLSERPAEKSWDEIFALLDEAVAAEGPLELDRDLRPAEERDWP
jgi:antitoxin VapB